MQSKIDFLELNFLYKTNNTRDIYKMFGKKLEQNL